MTPTCRSCGKRIAMNRTYCSRRCSMNAVFAVDKAYWRARAVERGIKIREERGK